MICYDIVQVTVFVILVVLHSASYALWKGKRWMNLIL